MKDFLSKPNLKLYQTDIDIELLGCGERFEIVAADLDYSAIL